MLPVETRPAPDAATERAADRIISEHVGASLVAAAVPLPLVDLAGLTAIRLRLAWALSRCYGQPVVRFDGGWRGVAPGLLALADDAAAIAISLSGRAGLTRSIARSMARSIPIIGPALGLTLSPGIAGSVTFAMGRIMRHVLREGGDLRDIDLDAARAELAEAVAEGQRFVHADRPAPSA